MQISLKGLKVSCMIMTLICCFSCQKVKENPELSNEEYDAAITAAFQEKSNQVQKKLLGKKSKSIEALLPDSLLVLKENQLIMVLSLYDCSSCVTKGVSFLDKYDDHSQFISHRILSGILFKERLFSEVRDNYIHDEGASIMKELGYFPTPALIDYNVKAGIQDIYMIPVFQDSLGLAQFETSLIKTP
jgi:hypothetical protein